MDETGSGRGGGFPVTREERLKIFKEITRNYRNYQEHIKGIDEKLEMLNAEMENVHSISFDKEASAPSYQERPMIELIERKALLEREKQYYQDLIAWVHEILDSFGSASIKALVWMTYVQRRSLASISDEYLISKDNLYKIRRKHLCNALSDEKMNSLNGILETYNSQ